MSDWKEWRDNVTVFVFAIGTLFGVIGSCNHYDARLARDRQTDAERAVKEDARKDAAPLIETCVTHPSARRVVVQ